MKKGIIVFAAVVTLGFITGCGKNKNQVVCTGKAKENGQSYEVKIVANLKKNKINDGYMEMKFSNEKTAQSMCGLMAMANGMAKKDSDKIDYKCKGKTLKINSLKTLDDDGKIIGMTKDEFIKQATSSSKDIKCK